MLSGNALMELERLYAEDFSNNLRNFIGGGNDVSQEGPSSSELSM
jgi:hypothetical protein